MRIFQVCSGYLLIILTFVRIFVVRWAQYDAKPVRAVVRAEKCLPECCPIAKYRGARPSPKPRQCWRPRANVAIMHLLIWGRPGFDGGCEADEGIPGSQSPRKTLNLYSRKRRNLRSGRLIAVRLYSSLLMGCEGNLGRVISHQTALSRVTWARVKRKVTRQYSACPSA